jgi:hypothetical protein
MELFLNICWLGLLLPAYALWRRSSRAPLTHASFVIICTLGCALVLLFPVISVSDDLHAIGQAMEESDPGFRHDGRCACPVHALHHAWQAALPVSAARDLSFEQVSTVLLFTQHSGVNFAATVLSGRAPPRRGSVSL